MCVDVQIICKQGMINVHMDTMRWCIAGEECAVTPGIILKSELYAIMRGLGLQRVPITIATSLFSNPT